MGDFFKAGEPPPAFATAPADAALTQRVSKLVEFSVRNGPSFLQLMRQKQAGNADYSFLEGGPGHEYWRWLLFCTAHKLPPDQPLQGPPPASSSQPQQQQQEQQQSVAPVLPKDVDEPWAVVLANLTGSRDSIRQSKDWFMACVTQAPGMAARVAEAVAAAPTYTRALHLLYLANDILLKGATQRAPGQADDACARAFRPVLPAMLRGAAAKPDAERAEAVQRLTSILDFWASRHVFDAAHTAAFRAAVEGQPAEEEEPAAPGVPGEASGASGDAAAGPPPHQQSAWQGAPHSGAEGGQSQAAPATSLPPPHSSAEGAPGVSQPQWQHMGQPGAPVSGPPSSQGGEAGPPPQYSAPFPHLQGYHPPGMQPGAAPGGPSPWGGGPAPGAYYGPPGGVQGGYPAMGYGAPAWGQPGAPGPYGMPMQGPGMAAFHDAPPPDLLPERPRSPGPPPFDPMSFPPGVIPALVRESLKEDDPYSPLSPLEIERMGTPQGGEPDAYLRSRLDQFYVELKAWRPGQTRAEQEDEQRRARARAEGRAAPVDAPKEHANIFVPKGRWGRDGEPLAGPGADGSFARGHAPSNAVGLGFDRAPPPVKEEALPETLSSEFDAYRKQQGSHYRDILLRSKEQRNHR